MSQKFDVNFVKAAKPAGGTAIVLQAQDSIGAPADADPAGVVARAADVGRFRAKALKSLDIVAPHGSPFDRIILVGLGDPAKIVAHDWLKAGGIAAAKARDAESVSIYLDAAGVEVGGQAAADFALGLLLGAYRFDTYKTKKDEDDQKANGKKPVKVTIVTAAAAAAKKAFDESEA